MHYAFFNFRNSWFKTKDFWEYEESFFWIFFKILFFLVCVYICKIEKKTSRAEFTFYIKVLTRLQNILEKTINPIEFGLINIFYRTIYEKGEIICQWIHYFTYGRSLNTMTITSKCWFRSLILLAFVFNQTLNHFNQMIVFWLKLIEPNHLQFVSKEKLKSSHIDVLDVQIVANWSSIAPE